MSSAKKTIRKIIHIDMDCFYAAIEVRDQPSLLGLPVAVGGRGNRGVAATCNYEARQYGVHSAMPIKQALRLCPQLQVIGVNMPKYKQASQQIRKIFQQYTDLVEPLSLDEAYLDVTDSSEHQGSATRIAHQIRLDIFEETALTASAGIGPNKMIAKIASDWRKPNGQFTVPPKEAEAFVAQLPIQKLWGVGKVTTQKLRDKGIFTAYQLKQFSLEQMIKAHGVFGVRLFDMVRGIDSRQVKPGQATKSVSVETTYDYDLIDYQQKCNALEVLVDELEQRLLNKNMLNRVKKCSIKVRNNQFICKTAEQTLGEFEKQSFQQLFKKLHLKDNSPIRLLGAGVSLFSSGFTAENNAIELPLDSVSD